MTEQGQARGEQVVESVCPPQKDLKIFPITQLRCKKGSGLRPVGLRWIKVEYCPPNLELSPDSGNVSSFTRPLYGRGRGESKRWVLLFCVWKSFRCSQHDPLIIRLHVGMHMTPQGLILSIQAHALGTLIRALFEVQ